MENRITGEKVGRIRTELDMTVEKFATLLNVSKKTVERWEKAETEINLGGAAGDKLRAIGNIFDDEAAKKVFKETIRESAPLGAIVGAALLAPLGTIATAGAFGAVTAMMVKKSLLKYFEQKEEK